MDDDYITDIIRRYEADLQNVKQNGWLIEIVKEQTYELCLEADKKIGGLYNLSKNKHMNSV